MPFKFEHVGRSGLVLIEAHAFEDERGFFMETYRRSQFIEVGITEPFVQGNMSWSRKGVLRGLHYQKPPQAQGKLVRAVEGEIYDVVVDTRPDSPGFGTWQGFTLSAANRLMLYVPGWFAHGFCVLSDEAKVSYDVTAEFAPDLERGVRWDDPALAIDWPVKQPVVSPKDQVWPSLEVAAHAP